MKESAGSTIDQHEIAIQPYQIFFPIGLMYAFWGALIWLLYLAGWVEYPGPTHAHLMIGGFLFSFALGFLMTAVPRFIGTAGARTWEIALAVLLSLASIFRVHQESLALSVLLFLGFFFLMRFRKRAYGPPAHFIFIPIGLLLGIAGAMMMIGSFGPGRVFLFQGTMLCFVLGVGGKLVSALLGWSSPPLVQITLPGKRERKSFVPVHVAIPALLLVLGFLLELTPYLELGRILRAAAASYVAIAAWRLYRLPKIRGRLTNGLWLSSWGLVLGLWLYGAVPALGVHALHLMFISGFGLMTLMIASRVTLAHGGYDPSIEVSSRAIRWSGALILIAASARVVAPLTSSYLNHLGYAATLWLVAIVIWASAFLPKIWRHSSYGRSSLVR